MFGLDIGLFAIEKDTIRVQADILKKLNKRNNNKKNKRILTDAMLITIAGVAAAMKNVG